MPLPTPPARCPLSPPSYAPASMDDQGPPRVVALLRRLLLQSSRLCGPLGRRWHCWRRLRPLFPLPWGRHRLCFGVRGAVCVCAAIVSCLRMRCYPTFACDASSSATQPWRKRHTRPTTAAQRTMPANEPSPQELAWSRLGLRGPVFRSDASHQGGWAISSLRASRPSHSAAPPASGFGGAGSLLCALLVTLWPACTPCRGLGSARRAYASPWWNRGCLCFFFVWAGWCASKPRMPRKARPALQPHGPRKQCDEG